MIIVTGGEGFIGKNLINKLKRNGFTNIINLDTNSMGLELIIDFITFNNDIECIFHLGAISDTTETNKDLLKKYNLDFSVFIWNYCTTFKIPLIYASSAATYGNGDNGFDDDDLNLSPLNLYGISKHQFDLFIKEQKETPPNWYGLKFFNVYGNGEAHKGKMASVVYHFYNQIKKTGELKLFKSHRDNILDGEQKRDFIYVDDIIDVCLYLYNNKPQSGIYNVGTGKARTYNDLAKIVFKTLGIEEKISYIDTPINIRNSYQYFTEAKMDKLKSIGYNINFHELEDGISKYINKL